MTSELTSVSPIPCGNFGLHNSSYTPDWHSDLAHSLLGTPLPQLLVELAFTPEARLTWFHRSIRGLSHHPEIPTSRLPQDVIFHFIAHLHEMNPIAWAWHSTEDKPEEVMASMSDSLYAQILDFNAALHEVEHTLAQD